MPKAVNHLAPKGTITLLVASVAILTALQGYTNIYPEMLSFVNNYFSVGSEGQNIVANLLTIMFVSMTICTLVCGYWSMLLLEKDAPNPLFPIAYISLPIVIVMVGIYSLM